MTHGHRWARVSVREGGYPKILAEGGSDFSARGGESLNKKFSLRGGTNCQNFAPEMLFLRGFGQLFEGLLNIDENLPLMTKNAGVSRPRKNSDSTKMDLLSSSVPLFLMHSSKATKNARFPTFLPNIICSEGLIFHFEVHAQQEKQYTLANFVQFGGKLVHQNPRKRGIKLIFSVKKSSNNSILPTFKVNREHF